MDWRHYVLFCIIFCNWANIFEVRQERCSCSLLLFHNIYGYSWITYTHVLTQNRSERFHIMDLWLVLYSFGNLLWIMSIKSAPSLSLIRVLMAGGETLLLVLAGYLVFKNVHYLCRIS